MAPSHQGWSDFGQLLAASSQVLPYHSKSDSFPFDFSVLIPSKKLTLEADETR